MDPDAANAEKGTQKADEGIHQAVSVEPPMFLLFVMHSAPTTQFLAFANSV